MKKAASLAVAVLVAAGVCEGAELTGMKRWAERVGPATVSKRLTGWGVKDAEDREAMTAAWDEGTVVERALAAKAYYVLAWAGRHDRLSPESVRKIREALVAEAQAPKAAMEVVRRLPAEAKAGFEKMVYDLVPVRFPGTPVFGRHYVKHVVLEGGAFVSARTDVKDMVELLLAPEPLEMRYTSATKKAIKDAAVVMARMKLRADGKSFVVKDGVNPLSEAIRPVVEALNAAGCVGIESALRALGAEVPDMDRSGLVALAAKWQEDLMAGRMSSGRAADISGKLAVALGVDGFNAFVNVYNNGTGEAVDGSGAE